MVPVDQKLVMLKHVRGLLHAARRRAADPVDWFVDFSTWVEQ
jgi:hypothetical protein